MYARSDQKARRRQAKSFRRREKNMPQIQNKALCIEKGRETSDKKSSIASDLKSAFGHINPQKAILAVGGCIFAVYLLSGLYVVNPGEQAVIRRFGAPLEQAVSEGLHYRLPFPIDTVEKVKRIGGSTGRHRHDTA